VRDARVLERNGDPTPLALAEQYVNQDEITFIAVPHVVVDDRPSTGFGDEQRSRPSSRRPTRSSSR